MTAADERVYNHGLARRTNARLHHFPNGFLNGVDHATEPRRPHRCLAFGGTRPGAADHRSQQVDRRAHQRRRALDHRRAPAQRPLHEPRQHRLLGLYSDFPIAGTIEFSITADPAGGDDDLFGFVLGWNPGDSSNPTADYLLVDWKKVTQTYQNWGTAQAGLALSRVTGQFTRGYGNGPIDLWSHTGVCTELARGTNYGATGWVHGTDYTFQVLFTRRPRRHLREREEGVHDDRQLQPRPPRVLQLLAEPHRVPVPAGRVVQVAGERLSGKRRNPEPPVTRHAVGRRDPPAGARQPRADGQRLYWCSVRRARRGKGCRCRTTWV